MVALAERVQRRLTVEKVEIAPNRSSKTCFLSLGYLRPLSILIFPAEAGCKLLKGAGVTGARTPKFTKVLRCSTHFFSVSEPAYSINLL